jgi:hypothetical protein
MASPVTAANLNEIRAVRVNLAVAEMAGRVGTVNRDSSGQVMCRNMEKNW